MGTTGSGSFDDYSHRGGPGGGGTGVGGPGGKGGQNVCEQVLPKVDLQEVARCDYYKVHKVVPSENTPVVLARGLVGNRLAVQAESGETIGLVPTKYNHLRGCQEQGYNYGGRVVFSAAGDLPTVTVELEPKT